MDKGTLVSIKGFTSGTVATIESTFLAVAVIGKKRAGPRTRILVS